MAETDRLLRIINRDLVNQQLKLAARLRELGLGTGSSTPSTEETQRLTEEAARLLFDKHLHASRDCQGYWVNIRKHGAFCAHCNGSVNTPWLSISNGFP